MKQKRLFFGMLSLALASSCLCLPASQTALHAEAVTSADLSISQNGLDFICGLEGYSATCYWDYSQSSIGYGTKCTGSSVQPHASGLHSTTKAAAQEAMRSGIANTYAPRVKAQTTGLTMNQNQFDALVSLAYNCGGGLNRIYNCPLVKYLRGEQTASQAYQNYTNYIVYAGGTWNNGLYNRRIKEANYFFSTADMNAPTTASVSVQDNRTEFTTEEAVVFTMSSDYGTTYYLGIDYEGERLLTPEVTSGNTYTHIFTDIGHYSVYVSAYNAYGFVNSSTITFDVVAPLEAPSYSTIAIDGGKTEFAVGEDVTFIMDSDTATTYYLGIDYEGVRLLTPKVADGNTYTHAFDLAGHYSVYVSSYNAKGFLNSSCIEFDVIENKISGDINQDKLVNLEDMELLKEYLIGNTMFAEEQFSAADINQDGVCNIYDMIILKKLVCNQS